MIADRRALGATRFFPARALAPRVWCHLGGTPTMKPSHGGSLPREEPYETPSPIWATRTATESIPPNSWVEPNVYCVHCVESGERSRDSRQWFPSVAVRIFVDDCIATHLRRVYRGRR